MEIMELKRIANYESRLEEFGIEIFEKIHLTPTIILYIFQHQVYPMEAWAFYPRTGCQDLVSIMGNEWRDVDTAEEFRERCIDLLLDRHDWFNPDVKKAIEARGRRSKQI